MDKAGGTRKESNNRKKDTGLERARNRLAMLLMAMFCGLCLVSMYAPNAGVLKEVLPVLMGALMLMAHYYFGRGRRS